MNAAPERHIQSTAHTHLHQHSHTQIILEQHSSIKTIYNTHTHTKIINLMNVEHRRTRVSVRFSMVWQPYKEYMHNMFVHSIIIGLVNKWVKRMEAENELKVIKLTDDDYILVIANAITHGYPVLLENIG